MTYRDICDRLQCAGIDNARYEAELLVTCLLGEPLSIDRDYVSPRLDVAIEKRCSGYPLQYILGKWWFCRCTFEVNESCLVPRPDTESVVEAAMKFIGSGARFADLCTGSGCIAIALLDLRRDLTAHAVEICPDTLELAVRNAHLNGVDDRLTFSRGDVLGGDVLGDEIYDAIISNPPYIRSDVIPTLAPEVRHDPSIALDGGEDGLVFYRAIVENYAANLAHDGCFIFEIGYDQAAEIEEIARANRFSCRIIKDLGGCDRVAILRRCGDENGFSE